MSPGTAELFLFDDFGKSILELKYDSENSLDDAFFDMPLQMKLYDVPKVVVNYRPSEDEEFIHCYTLEKTIIPVNPSIISELKMFWNSIWSKNE